MFICTLSLLVIPLILVLLIFNRKTINEYIRYNALIKKLPCAIEYNAVFGHFLVFLGLSPEQIFTKAKIWIQRSPPLSVIYTGLVQVIVVSAPEEAEVSYCTGCPKSVACVRIAVSAIRPSYISRMNGKGWKSFKRRYSIATTNLRHPAIIGQMRNLNKAFCYSFLHRWLGNGLLTSKDESWHKRRKILTPAFHFSILLQFVDTFNKETVNLCNLIEKKYLDKPVNIEPIISDYTLATMSKTSMGTKVNLMIKEGIDYKNAIYEQGLIVFRRFMAPWLWSQKLFDLTPHRRVEKKNLEILHKFTTNIIRKRSENFATFNEKFDDTVIKRKYPLLDILLNAKFKDKSIDDNGIREEVDTFMFEGHDTTATCLSFTTMLLACHKEIQDLVYQEIVSILGTDLSNHPTYANLQEMSLLERCIKESLRLYPPVSLIGRQISEETFTKYGTIPKDINSFVAIYELHRNPDIWPNPDEFDPSRHLPENCRDRHPFAFIPFSAGPRNCIGQRFAMLEIKAFFCTVLRKFILEPVDTPKSLVLFQEIILRTRNGITVEFKLRQQYC